MEASSRCAETEAANHFQIQVAVTGVGKCPNSTSPNYWGYIISNTCLKVMSKIPKKDIYQPLGQLGGKYVVEPKQKKQHLPLRPPMAPR